MVVDTSALMAIVLNEPAADACVAALEAEDDVPISAGRVAEALIVAARRVAKENGCRLLYVGGDFSKTDLGADPATPAMNAT